MDNYIVSARKYRPSTFRNVVGQKSLTVTLKNAIQNNKLAHAYLFCGPRGVGKTSCARIFAKTINCLNPAADGESCNVCESCQAFNEQRSYNIHELDAASNNSVDDIRTLIEQVRILPPIGKYKVFIIDEVHMLSQAAFNAFLKTLEEPPHHALFILATTEKHKVLPTILSRCQIYDFSRISISDMVEHLQYVAAQEGATAEAEALNVIAQKADGGMRDALSVFDQVLSFTNGNITYQAVIDNLNVLDYEYYFRLTDAILAGNVRLAVLILNEVLSKGFDGQNIITGLTTHFRDLLVCKDESTLILFEVGSSIRDRYIVMANRCSDSFLFRAIDLANTCDLNYRASRNKRLLLELALIQLCQLIGPGDSSDEESKKKRIIDSIPVSDTVSLTAPLVHATPTLHTVSPQAVQPTSSLPNVPPALAASFSPPPVEMKKKPRAPVHTSIKAMGEEKLTDTEKALQTEQEIEQVYTFDDEALLTVWNTFAERLTEQRHLKNIMHITVPLLKDNFLIEVMIHNPGQQTELTTHATDILSFLRKELRNTRIQMQFRIDEANDKKKVYTSMDKYEYLREVNPILDKLREEFNLKLD